MIDEKPTQIIAVPCGGIKIAGIKIVFYDFKTLWTWYFSLEYKLKLKDVTSIPLHAKEVNNQKHAQSMKNARTCIWQ